MRIFLGLTVVVLVVGVTLPGWVKNDLCSDAIREIKSYIVPVEHMVVRMHVVDVPSFKMLKVDITHLAHFFLFLHFCSFLAIRKVPFLWC